MLDIKFIRDNANKVKKGAKDKGIDADIDRLLKVDKMRRDFIQELEGLKSEQNKLSKVKPNSETIKKLKEDKIKIKGLEENLKDIDHEFSKLMLSVPNIPSHKMPNGKGEDDNIVFKAWRPDIGYIDPRKLKYPVDTKKLMPEKPIYAQGIFKPRHHIEIGKDLDIIDNEQSAKVCGSRFCYLKKDAVLLQYGILDLMMKKLAREEFTPMIVPLLVKDKALFGTSHFPGDQDQIYKIENKNVEENQDLYLVGSSEPSLFAYYMDKILQEEDLPQKMFAYSSCFRSEVGSWGRDVRGIKRVHQFDKLEMDVICSEKQSDKIYDELLIINEWLLQELKLPYHLVNKCTGDAGYYATHYQCDPEVWLAGQQEFMEVMTDTNASDFQARRLNIKYITRDGDKKYCHTVNDTGVAMGRMIIAIIDNYQQNDGSVKVPDILQNYVGKEIIKKTI
ncbi:serine--tRNA ligase [Candidatus Kuenenbacteria bacterium CG11_big_fil_rev_8_21_14_0_20_37_9]|uniref:Serine--tRNA ligase n=2 Tax=Candidatus Kueneniibacteriota TaxID=1752740 RepID=A0A2M6XST3_9BACT|nr:MAG: serine--tRNA ligase [Candidatus Kuenenbacteria bacterium CG1_02_38_13]PIR05897.1 MAG: serine--tRNA ligase [Candidatus Kuenenbacteria bacterium CG11_big_fil_rev_8_21_14_0_20_37_9]PIU10696.1 MAG: serine--tRNA ligase [Candidatus Kuenenbacteria bacterium CG08_land_8_20_14_0_20_37_23]